MTLDGASDETITGNWTFAPVNGVGSVTSEDLAVGRAAPLNVRFPEFGAVGDGVTDDTAAIQAAIDKAGSRGGGMVYLPPGSYKLSATLIFTVSSVHLVGAGSGVDTASVANPQWSPATELVWQGDASPVISCDFVQGMLFQHFSIDGGDLATRAFDLDVVQHSTFRSIGVRKLDPVTGVALYGSTTRTTVNIGTQWNSFDQVFARCPTLLHGTSDSGNPIGTASDFTLNTMTRCTVSYGSDSDAPGMRLEIADGNTFHGIHMHRRTGNGYGLEIGQGGRGNVFTYLNTGRGGIHVATPAIASWSNLIIGYSRGDGTPEPVLEAGANLEWIENSRDATGWYVNGFGQSFGVGTLTPTLFEGGLGIHVKTTDGEVPEIRLEGTADSSSAALEVLGRTDDSGQVRGRVIVTSAGSLDIGTITDHSVVLRQNNSEVARLQNGRFVLGGTLGSQVITGTGPPEARFSAPVGSLFLRGDGGAGSTLYVKQSGGTGNTGWVAK